MSMCLISGQLSLRSALTRESSSYSFFPVSAAVRLINASEHKCIPKSDKLINEIRQKSNFSKISTLEKENANSVIS